MEKEKAAGKGKKYHRVCIFLTDEEMDKLFDVVYKERAVPAKIFRKALMSYIEKSLSGSDVKREEDEEVYIW